MDLAILGAQIMNNSVLNRAKRQSSDNWYTTYESVESELLHYTSQFVGKRVLCNADDPIESAFTCYFINNFQQLQLKSLTCIAYGSSKLKSLYQLQHSLPNSYAICINATGKSIVLLKSGEFDGDEVQPYWENADIVCTNPPFSKFRQFFDLVQRYQLHYLIISNLNAVTYTNVFPYVQSGVMKLGYNCGMKFRVPVDEFSKGWMGTAVWLTDLQVTPRPLVLSHSYSPELYSYYDNQSVIHVDKVANIPQDYLGVMGVPITYLRYHDSSQYQVVGLANHGNRENDLFVPRINGKQIFKRLLIQKCSTDD